VYSNGDVQAPKKVAPPFLSASVRAGLESKVWDEDLELRQLERLRSKVKRRLRLFERQARSSRQTTNACSTAGLEPVARKSCNVDDNEAVSGRSPVEQGSQFAALWDHDSWDQSSLPKSVLDARLEKEERHAASGLYHDGVRVWSTWTPPPTGARTPPPDRVYPDYVEENFAYKLQGAFHLNKLVQGWRCGQYGSEVANLWRKGSTPEEDRERWKAQVVRTQAELEEVSDSD